ncbi:hypothetical protein PYW07_007798 [Mythimna separata]|uniref:PHD-type domain-containing protein n=1 Tax=Mythimna separata TaxID=271217 RepID=A0AAD7YR27_MYTSE|nr:hypothetical protein PYW07_007798 [Mythimna separata]
MVGPGELSIKCCVCDDTYHLNCLSVTKQQFSRLTRDQKVQWKCHPCSNITRRGRPTSASLNRSVYTPSNCEDSMNMSCENIEQEVLPLSCASSSTSAIVAGASSSCTTDVNVKMISQELNNTLKGWRADMDHAMTKFTNDIKGTLGSWREDMENSMSKFNDSIKSTIADFKLELNTLRCEHEKLKECFHTATQNVSELNASVQFLSAEQEDLKKRVGSIACDSSDQSQTLINGLERKIDSLEQQARQCNVEVSNVPERRGENLLHMMELLGIALNFPILQTGPPLDVLAPACNTDYGAPCHRYLSVNY